MEIFIVRFHCQVNYLICPPLSALTTSPSSLSTPLPSPSSIRLLCWISRCSLRSPRSQFTKRSPPSARTLTRSPSSATSILTSSSSESQFSFSIDLSGEEKMRSKGKQLMLVILPQLGKGITLGGNWSLINIYGWMSLPVVLIAIKLKEK
ncbi:hypothetical protein Syun_001729 [Stephania yunnanensis]|uniref:Uncharacterized protein n=1 Tax=Stephania yunnanensis TaxID=152371 RepID=A0AAP0LIE5_9MAGN